MAELIPLEYRMRVAQRQRLNVWMALGIAAAVIVGVSLVYTYMWDRQKASDYEALSSAFHDKSALIARSHDLRSRRQELADRMQKIQELMDDKMLLLLLQNICGGFSNNDCLTYVSIEAHKVSKDDKEKEKAAGGQYAVHIVGITTNSTTLAELMTRLSKRADPPMNVVLEASHREKALDGQVMHFQILCEKSEPKGT